MVLGAITGQSGTACGRRRSKDDGKLSKFAQIAPYSCSDQLGRAVSRLRNCGLGICRPCRCGVACAVVDCDDAEPLPWNEAGEVDAVATGAFDPACADGPERTSPGQQLRAPGLSRGRPGRCTSSVQAVDRHREVWWFVRVDAVEHRDGRVVARHVVRHVVGFRQGWGASGQGDRAVTGSLPDPYRVTACPARHHLDACCPPVRQINARTRSRS